MASSFYRKWVLIEIDKLRSKSEACKQQLTSARRPVFLLTFAARSAHTTTHPRPRPHHPYTPTLLCAGESDHWLKRPPLIWARSQRPLPNLPYSHSNFCVHRTLHTHNVCRGRDLCRQPPPPPQPQSTHHAVPCSEPALQQHYNTGAGGVGHAAWVTRAM